MNRKTLRSLTVIACAQYQPSYKLRLAVAAKAILSAILITGSTSVIGETPWSIDSGGTTDGGGISSGSDTSTNTSSSASYAMHLSDNNAGGEVLLFPYFALSNEQTTTITVSNSADHVKAVHLMINEGLRGATVRSFHLYLGPRDDFTLTLAQREMGGYGSNWNGGAMIHSDSTCTVPAFRDTWIPFTDVVIDEGVEDQIDSMARTLTGSIMVVEMGQWDAVSSFKGAKAAAGAAGDNNACAALIEAWSSYAQPDPEKPWASSWKDNPTDEALSWQGGGLSGRATVADYVPTWNGGEYRTVVDYYPVVIDDFARRRISAEYHQSPGFANTVNYPYPTLSAGSLSFQPCVSTSSDCGTTEIHHAVSGLDALSALLSQAQIGPLVSSQVADNSGISWILSMPTKSYHTESAARLGPFASVWSSSKQPACDDVSVGTPSAAENSILLNPNTVSLCAAVNVLQLPKGNATPLATESWLESTFSGAGSPPSLAISMAQKDPGKATRDRRLGALIEFDSDTEIVGLPVIAIPVYKNVFDDFDSAPFSSSVERINKRLSVSTSEPSFPTATSIKVNASVTNTSGNAVREVSGVCHNVTNGVVKTVVSSSPELTFTSLSAGSYDCFTQASVARGNSERDYFSIKIGLPQPPKITNWETDDGVITLYFEDTSDSQFSATSFKAECVSERGGTFTASGAMSPLTLSGLSTEETYTCTVSGENVNGAGNPSKPTTAITPEFTPSGLPIWLLYEASKRAG